MKPFDLEKALAGAKVVTRDGCVVEQLTFFRDVKEAYCVHAVVVSGQSKRLETFTREGVNVVGNDATSDDLFLASEKKEGWVAVYPASVNNIAEMARGTTGIYLTKDLCEKFTNHYGRIDIVRIEWEE